jgi:hypothetical protein
MKTKRRTVVLTLGDFIAHVYSICDEREAWVIVWLAFHAGLLVVHGDRGRALLQS